MSEDIHKRRIFNQESNCLHPETDIRTIDGLKPIKDIKEGDLVLTHRGRFRKVLKVMKREQENEAYKITIGSKKNTNIITGNHPIYRSDGTFQSIDENQNTNFVVSPNLTLDNRNSNIFKVEKDDYNGEVYNIEVEEDNSYCTNIVVVHNCSFTGSSENVFDVDVIEDMMTRCINPISSNNGLKIFEEPIQGEKYAIGADTAQGVIKGDYSAAVVLRKSTNTVVATFHKRIPIEQYSKILFDLSIKYNKALIGVESNNHGHAVLQYLKNYGANLYHQKTYDNYNKKWTTRIGWNTNGKTKPIMINELADNIRNYNITVLDKEILEEMTKFVFVEVGKSEKMEASKGYHDDYTMSLAICQQILKDVILFHKPIYKQADTIEQYLKKKYRSSIDSVYEKTGYY